MRRAFLAVTLSAAQLPLLSLGAPIASAQVTVPQFSAEEVTTAQRDPGYFTVDPQSIVVREVGKVVLPPKTSDVTPPASPVLNPEVDWGEIINLGKAIWQIIEANKPVVDVKTEFASALPKGVKSPDELAGWKPPEGTVYELTAKNVYGAQVVHLRYQVLRTAGGNYFNHGKYLAAVTVQPLDIDVLWGYRFSLDAKIPSITNAGTRQDPDAGMLVTVAWKMQTPLKENDGATSYYLQGDGLFQTVKQTDGGPAALTFKPFDPARFGLLNPEQIRW